MKRARETQGQVSVVWERDGGRERETQPPDWVSAYLSPSSSPPLSLPFPPLPGLIISIDWIRVWSVCVVSERDSDYGRVGVVDRKEVKEVILCLRMEWLSTIEQSPLSKGPPDKRKRKEEQCSSERKRDETVWVQRGMRKQYSSVSSNKFYANKGSKQTVTACFQGEIRRRGEEYEKIEGEHWAMMSLVWD